MCYVLAYLMRGWLLLALLVLEVRGYLDAFEGDEIICIHIAWYLLE